MRDALNAEPVWSLVESRRDAFYALSDQVWDTPELNYEERRSADAHRAMLEREGFSRRDRRRRPADRRDGRGGRRVVR